MILGFWKGLNDDFAGLGTIDVKFDQSRGDGEIAGSARAAIEEIFGHAGRDGRISWASFRISGNRWHVAG